MFDNKNSEVTINNLIAQVESLSAELAREREITKALTYAINQLQSNSRLQPTYQRVIHYRKKDQEALCNAYGTKLNFNSEREFVTCRRCLGFLDRANAKLTDRAKAGGEGAR